MDRTNGAGHIGRMFVAEDSSIGRPPTEITDAWLNGVQEELIGVIEAAGIVPSEANLSQLLAALRSAGVFQTQPTNDSSTKVATTAFANPGASLGVNGSHPFPSGLIIKWFGLTVTNIQSSYSFPLAFPNGCFRVFLVDGDASAAGVTFGAHPISAAQFSAICSSASVAGVVIAFGY